MNCNSRFGPLVAILLACLTQATAGQSQTVEVVRDLSGTPHVFATTNKGACHGAGYVAASDRLFQMDFFRRSVRGQLAAVFPANPYDLALPSDERMRLLGLGLYADELVAHPAFDADTLGLLNAYAQGVNLRLAEIRQNQAPWPPMFLALSSQPAMADWTAADCILVWMYAQDVFSAFSDGDQVPYNPGFYPALDVGGAVLPNLGNGLFARLLGGKRRSLGEPPAPEWTFKASHNLVTHGSRTATGKPLVLAKPQHPLMSPSLYYEYAMRASQGDLDCRGAGLAGCPAFFHGWNRYSAWSLTSMPADLADVYTVQFTDALHTKYLIDGVEHVVDSHSSQIEQVGQSPVTVVTRRTHWGPLVRLRTGAASLPPTQEYAMRSLILDDAKAGKHSITAALRLMRADTKAEIVAALHEWRSPSVHLLIATVDNAIGYRAVTGLPLRPGTPQHVGHEILSGNTSASEWPGEVTPSELPAYWGTSALDRPYLSSANNLACDPALLPQPFILGQAGETDRSWRLREMMDTRLALPQPLTGAEVLAMDHDSVNPTIRTLIVLARAMENAGVDFSAYSQDAEDMLHDVSTWGAPWKYDATVNALHPAMFDRLSRIHKALTDFNLGTGPAFSSWNQYGVIYFLTSYGSRGIGVMKLLKTLAGNETNYETNFPAPRWLEAWVASELQQAKNLAWVGTPPSATQYLVPHQWNLKTLRSGGPSNWPAKDVLITDLQCAEDETIWSQSGETYKFFANFDATYPDGNYALLAPGVSEDWNNTTLYDNHSAAWRSGTMYRAKMTRGTFAETPVKTWQFQ